MKIKRQITEFLSILKIKKLEKKEEQTHSDYEEEVFQQKMAMLNAASKQTPAK
jgi:hypothetical protein